MRPSRSVYLSLSLALLGGCASSESPPADTGPAPDPARWVASSIGLPTTLVQSQQYGLDLDGNGTVDNQMGSVLTAMLVAGMGWDPQAGVDTAVAHGQIILLARVEPTTGTGLTFHLGRGSAPTPAPCVDLADETCAQHLHGDGSFTALTDHALGGRQASDIVSAGPGSAYLPLTFGAAFELPLSKARVRIDRLTVPVSGVLAGGIPQTAVTSILVPAMAEAFQAMVDRDCPTPTTCLAGSEGSSAQALFDANDDGIISPAELLANSLIQSLLQPDLDLDATPGSDALSVGVRVEFVGATF